MRKELYNKAYCELQERAMKARDTAYRNGGTTRPGAISYSTGADFSEQEESSDEPLAQSPKLRDFVSRAKLNDLNEFGE